MEAAALRVELGEFLWHELNTTDIEAAIEFYSQVLGWDTWDYEYTDDYSCVLWLADDVPVAGMLSTEPDGIAPHWTAYVHTPDYQATAQRAEAFNDVLMESFDATIGGRGDMIIDTVGTYVWIVQPEDSGPAPKRPMYSSFTWNVLFTPHVSDAVEFYQSVFEWQMLDDVELGDGRTCRIFGKNGKAFGAIQDVPLEPEMEVSDVGYESFWIYYASVANLVETLSSVVVHGGRIVSGPVDDATGARIAHCIDPQGAPFALREARGRS